MSGVDLWGPFLCWMLLLFWYLLLRSKQRELLDEERKSEQRRLDLDAMASTSHDLADELSQWTSELVARERAVTECTAAIQAQINKQIAASMRTIKYLENEARPAVGQTPEKT